MAARKDFYATMKEAADAAKALGITTRQQYVDNYRKDPKLPNAPARVYPMEWKGFPNFLGTDAIRFYATYEEARQAVTLIEAYSFSQYQNNRHKDPLLPSTPNRTYEKDWSGWGHFLPKDPAQLYYATLSEAAVATNKMGITSIAEYKQNYQRDPLLHSNPNSYYPNWNGFPDFFDRHVERYARYAQAKDAVKVLGATTPKEYRARLNQDVKLPVSPETFYGDWPGWKDFLSNAVNSKFYSSLEEASQAVNRLGINSQGEYKQRYREDEKLPSNPNAVYADDWRGDAHFYGRTKERYSNYAEAKEATVLIGAYTSIEYRAKCSVDPMLPTWPEEVYEDWEGWHDFLPKNPISKFYETLPEAAEAARKLGIDTAEKYRELYHKDSKLPSNAWVVYKKEWAGFPHFFSLHLERYATYSQAKEAAKSLEAYTSAEYLAICKNDPLLPLHPDIHYRDEWTDWSDFLPPNPRKRQGKYETLAHATNAAQSLGFKIMKEYQAGYKRDPKLPSDPSTFYSAEWGGWAKFLRVGDSDKKNIYYETYALAQNAAEKLNAESRQDYWDKRFQDEKLPAYPDVFYKGPWSGWRPFLGNTAGSKKYETYEEARAAARALNFSSNLDYKSRYKALDDRLPGAPSQYFKDKWLGWSDYLGTSKGKTFYSYEDAKKRVSELRIFTLAQYKDRYRQDPLLPSNPNLVYEGVWPGFKDFLSTPRLNAYETLDLAKSAVRSLGISSVDEYKIRYAEDPCLPSNPNIVYKDEWVGFGDYFGDHEPLYETVSAASAAAKNLGFRSKKEYLEGYKADPRLPSSPHQKYAGKWKNWGWDAYLGIDIYKDIREAGEVARSMGIACASDYRNLSSSNLRLPANPPKYYGAAWQGWVPFLLPDACLTLADVKFVIKLVGIKNSQEYRDEQKRYSCLPAHPDRMFSTEWIDWYDTCAIPQPYSYDEAFLLVSSQKLAGTMEYRSFVTKLGDLRLPRYPEAIYKDVWVNWYKFLGNPEPYKAKYIPEPYLAWKDSIDEFMEVARGGEAKESQLCRFVRHYIQEYELGHSPEVFLTSPKIDLKLFELFIAGVNTENNQRYVIAAAKEFCTHIVRKKLTVEDEETGEIVLVPNARNPFETYLYDGSNSSASTGESGKPALAYQYVHAMCEWIVPPGSGCFRDLSHLQIFDADWVDIDPSLVDLADPDCVIKQEYGRTKIWNPVYWMHTYALASVPARGRQLAYNDSGEGDTEIPEIVDGKIVFARNTTPLAGLTKEQGFVKQYPEGSFGMHFTSNKTSVNGASYSVAWMPEQLALWMIRLRRWQSKYNPITRAMPWTDCKRTELNKKQLVAKKSNCFLFRDFGDEECGHFSSRLNDRLAAALYYSQPSGLELATLSGKASALSTYDSVYSPHSMRVSLITAYIMEFGLPLEIVMKIAGHSAIVMTIYYVKLNAEGLRQKFSEGEKRALSNQVNAAIQMIEQNRINEIKETFINNNDGVIEPYMGAGAPGSFLFRDYGFCPFAGNRCGDGGPLIGKTQVRASVPPGYLGFQNCTQCRHFVTGPVFIGGLLSLANEISLQASYQFEQIANLESKVSDLRVQINKLEDDQYDASKSGDKYDPGDLNFLELQVRKLNSELESAAKKADMFLCDIQAIARFINQSQALVNERVSSQGNSSLTQLIVQSGNELHVAMEETSRFHQLSEVCQNAEIYQSASAELALAPRSQMIDKMLAFNNMMPRMFAMDKDQQLVIGNQLTNLMMSRVKSWATMDLLVDRKMLLEDLGENERILLGDFQSILDAQPAVLASEE
jgi:hypothetical protein